MRLLSKFGNSISEGIVFVFQFKEQFSRLAKSAASNIFPYFVSFQATRVKD